MHSWLVKGVLVVFTVIFSIGVAPYYLLYSEPPVASDVVVVLLGPVMELRTNRANGIVNKGLAQHMFIPGLEELMQINDAGVLEEVSMSELLLGELDAKSHSKIRDNILENTHREILMAKNLMTRLDWHSGIFVSSPYHMRRIKLIADREFIDGRFSISFVPSDEPIGKPYLWWMSKENWWWVSREYIKICWFWMYMPFIS